MFHGVSKEEGEMNTTLDNIFCTLEKELSVMKPYLHQKSLEYSVEDRVIEEAFDEWAEHMNSDGYSVYTDLFKFQYLTQVFCDNCKRSRLIYDTATSFILQFPEGNDLTSISLSELFKLHFGKLFKDRI